MKKSLIDFYSRLAHGIAEQFGPKCEVVIHDLQTNDPEHSIIAIENGHVTGRSIGDGPSHIALESLQHAEHQHEDKLAYLTRTKDGRILKSSTIYIRNETGRVIGIFCINYDITLLLSLQDVLGAFTGPQQSQSSETSSETVSMNISDLLDELIEQSHRLVGKPVELMTKNDKVRFVKFLNDAGAFLVTKSGPKVCQYLGISKFTLYSYLDEIKTQES